ncbi:MAG: glucose 1-dehydrogenase [Pirellulales bacterium]|nr:glucose 1-dehydrogenase [Pirellulales bacterium]
MRGTFDLSGKIALISGASRGIGQAIALALAEAGADVALAARSTDALEAVAAEARAHGCRVAILPTDVTDLDQVRGMVDRTVEHLGRIDILVNAAGVAQRSPTIDLTEADFDRVYAANIKAVTFACAAAGKRFIAQGSGKVINIASLTAALGLPGRALYGSTKGAVAQLTRSLAVEWGPHGICVNAIAPGWIDTALARPVLRDPAFRAQIIARTPIGRVGEPDDLGGTAVFLASSASDFVTGQVLFVDGGYISA